jgi:hypothetical protein
MGVLERVGVTLGGGGIRGCGSLGGFLSAVDLFLLSHDVTDFESFSGISAGAIVAAYLAAGISPHDYVRANMMGRRSGACNPVRRRDVYRPNWGELLSTPARLVRTLARRGKQGKDARAILGVLPSGLLRNDRVGKIIRENLEALGANDFRKLKRRLSVVFYDLLRNERVACGTADGEVSDVPIHEAVLASTSVPGVFTPRRVRLGERWALGVDGGTGGISIATSAADKLDVLLTYNDSEYLERESIEHASAISILSMSFRLLFNQRNVDEIASFVDGHVATHVFPFETAAGGDTGSFSWDGAIRAAREAFDRTKRQLAERFDYFALVLEPRGVRLNPDVEAVRFDEVAEKGSQVKLELKRRHGFA